MNTGNPLSPSSRYPPSHVEEGEEHLTQEAPDTGIFSAYHRETIFRGTNLESPAPTLNLRLPGFETPLPTGIPQSLEKQVTSDPVSPADSDPFSDYLSYESEQVDVRDGINDHINSGAGGQETPRRFDNDTPLPFQRQQQQRPRIITDNYQPQAPPSFHVQIPSRSPLDELRYRIHTPSDLPTSPSPFSPKPPRNIPIFSHTQQPPLPAQVRLPPTAAYPRAEFAREGWEPSGMPIIDRPRSSGATIPNYSLPSFKPPDGGSQEKTGAGNQSLGVRERWVNRYRRVAPILSCILAIALAVGLTICGRGSKTGISRIAKIPSTAFVDLGNEILHVELFPSGVCLVDGSDRSLLLVDVGFTMSAIFAIFLAAYLVITALLSSMLLNTLKLPVCYFTGDKLSKTYREKLDQVYTQASQEDLIVIFWLWWGHHHAPLNIIFLLATFSSVSIAMVKLAAVLSRLHGDLTIGAGLVIPVVCLFLYLTWILEVGAFLANPFTLFGNLCYNPKLRAEDEWKSDVSHPGSEVLQTQAHSIVTAAQSTPRLARQSPFHQLSFGKKNTSATRTANTLPRSDGSGTSSFVVYERPETEFSSYRDSASTTFIDEADRLRNTIHSPVQYRSAVTPQSIHFFSTPQSSRAIWNSSRAIWNSSQECRHNDRSPSCEPVPSPDVRYLNRAWS